MHEFGHYCIDTFSLDHSEGGNHSYTDSSLDLRLAWSEGVATWISCAIRDDDEYRDSNGSSVSHYKITDAPNNSSARTSANEWAVSYLIWKASKNVGTFDNTVTVLASFKNLTEQISLDTFYDQWQSVIGTASNLATYVDQVGMSYKLDNDEPSASTSPVDLGALSGTTTKSSLTFFGTGDEDIYKFTPSANTIYTINTQNTKNGALTQLDIYKGNLSTLIGSNAQANGSFGDSTSSIGVTATDATPIYIKVTRFNSSTHNYGYGNSSTPYGKTVGKYGSYDVNVSIGGSSGSVSPPTTSSSVASSGGGGGGCLLR